MIKPTEITIKFKAGVTTCAYERGKFCSFLRAKKFGTIPYCSLFEEVIYPNEDSCLARCTPCLKISE